MSEFRVQASSGGKPSPIGLAILEDLNRLPEMRTFVHTYEVSSHDKTGLGFDGGRLEEGTESYLYKEGASYVLFDEIGPGGKISGCLDQFLGRAG
ncbi:MAG: hypothetical protein IIC89_08850 [Chloroflexi bacterium]|nr:hypothetical protein [Chloroflexota bacterium]